MKIHFTGDGRQSFDRTRYLWGALIKNFHTVSKSRRWKPPPEGCHIWFHDVEYQFPFTDHLKDRLLDFPGSLVLYRTDDTLDFPFQKIPDDLLARADLLLASHWRAEDSAVPKALQDRWGYINPILRPFSPHAGSPLCNRERTIVFYGVRTGGKNFPEGRNSREEAVRLLQGGDLPFEGGLVDGGADYPTAKELLVPRISGKEHFRRLDSTAICLCLWGHCPLTYRFFEGLSRRNLVVTQTLAGIRFARGGLQPDVHYVETKADLSDLKEKLDYYLNHIDEAQRIADAGHERFTTHFAFRGLDFPQPLFEEICSTWGGILEEVHTPTLRARAVKRALPWIRNLPTDRPTLPKGVG